MNIIWNNEDYLMHYGMPRRLGRYKWGSGKNPYHHGADGGNIRKAKKEYKSAQEEYTKAYKKYSKYGGRHPIGTMKFAANKSARTTYGNKVQTELNNRFEDVLKKGATAGKTQERYKQLKKDYKNEKKENRKIHSNRIKELDNRYDKIIERSGGRERRNLNKQLEDAHEKYEESKKRRDDIFNNDYKNDTLNTVMRSIGTAYQSKAKSEYKQNAIKIMERKGVLDERISQIEDKYWGERRAINKEYRSAMKALKRTRKGK